jgi:ABC-2 type transport system ATP-binding protein
MASYAGDMSSGSSREDTTASIDVTDLAKSFGQVQALDGVSLRVHPGEVYGLLGANGAGKTTLMRCLLGYLNPSRGSARTLGGNSRDVDVRCRVGYLPGDLRLPVRSAVQDILRFHTRLQAQAGRPAADVDDLLTRLEVPTDRRFGALSKGNRQKVGLALSLLADPEVLVLDEPTSGLDPRMQELVLDIVRERRAKGAAVLLSTHILSEAEAIADRVGVLSHGTLVAEAPLGDLLERAQQSIEVALDDPPPPNILDGTPGLVRASVQGTEVQAIVTGSLSEAIRALAPYGVRRIATRAHELDEMFQQTRNGAS